MGVPATLDHNNHLVNKLEKTLRDLINTARTKMIDLIELATVEALNGPTNGTRDPATSIISKAAKGIELMNTCDSLLNKLEK
jgi:hypothetical protein